MVNPTEVATSQEPLSDEDVVARVLAGETGMFEIVMRRHNQRLYRVARAILRNDGEAEDVMQDAYVRAYEHLDQFAGRAKFSTWLTRIAVHEALARQRRGNRYQELESMSEREGDPMDRFASLAPDPEQQASSSEIRRLLEEAVEKLPDAYRTNFHAPRRRGHEHDRCRGCPRNHRGQCQSPPPSSAGFVTQKSLCACGNGKERSIQFSCRAV
jgi:RNA polymerase sigma factor (sigma-70 family)